LKPLEERDYVNTTTYKNYAKYIGSIVNISTRIMGDKKTNSYVITAVKPQKWFRNKFAFSLKAFGEHDDIEYGCAWLLKKINNSKMWEIIESKSFVKPVDTA